ncbi:MBL fold metallo-hydrolase [Nocardioides terrisoli]|uniref:MBL fold metallo-hydrolase n=1 Tax=Nocardioides terrisoli TaxID=3388267 RepID=UPI00287BBB27|nr:MBL fold metallo-hydrolase [Nocardioides marmorisolisilvae]
MPQDATQLTGDLRSTRTRVILLGTAAGPYPEPGRQGCASLLVVGGRSYLVDAGYGTVRKFVQSGVMMSSLAATFVTHLHSDHVADLFNLFLLGWGTGGHGLVSPVKVFGPGNPHALPASTPGVTPAPLANPDNPSPGTSELLAGAVGAWAYDLNIRTRYNSRTGLASLIEAHDVLPPADTGATADAVTPDMEPFVVFEDDRVRVSATLVKHPPVFPSFGYRFETEDGVFVFSGDTAPHENVVRLAAGADLLVHETMHIPYYASIGYPQALLDFFESSHTPPEDVGRIAREAGARQVALSHIGPGDPREVSDREWRRAVRSGFGGEVVVGHDLHQLAFPQR